MIQIESNRFRCIYRRAGMNVRVLDANSEMESPGGWSTARKECRKRSKLRVDPRILVITH